MSFSGYEDLKYQPSRSLDTTNPSTREVDISNMIANTFSTWSVSGVLTSSMAVSGYVQMESLFGKSLPGVYTVDESVYNPSESIIGDII